MSIFCENCISTFESKTNSQRKIVSSVLKISIWNYDWRLWEFSGTWKFPGSWTFSSPWKIPGSWIFPGPLENSRGVLISGQTRCAPPYSLSCHVDFFHGNLDFVTSQEEANLKVWFFLWICKREILLPAGGNQPNQALPTAISKYLSKFSSLRLSLKTGHFLLKYSVAYMCLFSSLHFFQEKW